MKKLLLSLLLCATTSVAAVADNQAINFPTPISSGARQAPRLTVDETVLGVERPLVDTWLEVTNSFTMSAWIKLNGVSNYYSGMNLMGHQAQDHVNYNGSFFVCVPAYSNTVKLCGKYNRGTGYTVSTGKTVDTEWHYYSVVYDAAATTISIYIDGEKLGEQNFGSNMQLFPDNPGVLFFGTNGSSAAYDEALIYSGALTADQIKTAMNAPTSVATPLCYYTFDAVSNGTTGQFDNFGSKKDVKAIYRIGTGSADGSGVISCGTNHVESAPELVAGRTTTGIADIAVDNNAPVRMFNLSGVEVNAETATPGLYIRTKGGRSEKVLVK